MLEQIATCEKVFEVSKANKVLNELIFLVICTVTSHLKEPLSAFFCLIFGQVIIIIHIVDSE